jgi:hypothetical protein
MTGMKRTTLIISLILASAFMSNDVIGQKVIPVRDKYVLLTMPYNQRPLSLYRGQFQVNAGYKFAVRAQSFDSEGELVNLKDNGTGSVYHYYFGEVIYGVTDFMEIGAVTNFLRRGIRDVTVTVVNATPTTTERITVNKLTESKGMGDIFLFTTVRLPIRYRWFDFGIKGGMFLPSAKYEPLKPANTVEAVTLASESSTSINLHYKNKNGYGVPVLLAAAAAKFTYGNLSAEAEWSVRDPVKEGQNIRWEETLAAKEFYYYDRSYGYLLSRTWTFDASMHYQATGWFNLSLNGSYFKTKGGWTEYWGNKYENPKKRLLNIEPGFELQISPGLTVYQVAGFPVSGKNSDAPFYMYTTISFNMFPFLR